MPTKRDILIFYLLSFTWGIVYTLVGLFALLGVIIINGRKNLKIRIIAGRIAVTTLGPSHWGGISLGIVYMISMSDSHRLHTHELGHTVQAMKWGIFFIPFIALPSVIRVWVRTQRKQMNPDLELPPYDSVWFEGNATKIGMNNFYDIVTEKLKEIR